MKILFNTHVPLILLKTRLYDPNRDKFDYDFYFVFICKHPVALRWTLAGLSSVICAIVQKGET